MNRFLTSLIALTFAFQGAFAQDLFGESADPFEDIFSEPEQEIVEEVASPSEEEAVLLQDISGQTPDEEVEASIEEEMMEEDMMESEEPMHGSATEPDAYLPDVRGVSAQALPGGALISWNAVDGADQYVLYYGPQSIHEEGVGEYENAVSVMGDTQFEVTDLTPGEIYFFAVVAENMENLLLSSLNYSEEVSVTPMEVTSDESYPAADIEGGEEVIEAVAADGNEAAAEESASASEATLPQSGPVAAAAFAAAAGASFFFLRKKNHHKK